jgi:hypothetical protein
LLFVIVLTLCSRAAAVRARAEEDALISFNLISFYFISFVGFPLTKLEFPLH